MEISKETLFLILLIMQFLCVVFFYLSNQRLLKQQVEQLKQKAEQWVALTVKDKKELDEMMTRMSYTNSKKFVMDALENHIQLFEMINEKKHRRLAIADLNELGSSYKIERLIQPVGIDYTKIHQPLN